MVVGTLLGYLPNEGVMEIRTGTIVQTFSVSGEVRERLNREPGYYNELETVSQTEWTFQGRVYRR